MDKPDQYIRWHLLNPCYTAALDNFGLSLSHIVNGR